MAKRAARKTDTLTDLVVELNQLDARREQVIDQINRAVQAMVSGSTRQARMPAAKPARRRRRGGRPKGFKVSEATKAKLRAAWKKRKTATL